VQWSTKKVHAFLSSSSIEFQETDMNQGKNITQYILKNRGEFFFVEVFPALHPADLGVSLEASFAGWRPRLIDFV
jgi:hypothetical protein